MAPGWCSWTPPWNRTGSHNYLFGEGQVQVCQDKPEPG